MVLHAALPAALSRFDQHFYLFHYFILSSICIFFFILHNKCVLFLFYFFCNYRIKLINTQYSKHSQDSRTSLARMALAIHLTSLTFNWPHISATTDDFGRIR